MSVRYVSIDEAVTYLNDLIALDRQAMAALVANRVPCNRALADHPTAQVAAQHGGFQIGMLGVLNGLFGCDALENGYIVFVFEEGDLHSVRRGDVKWADE